MRLCRAGFTLLELMIVIGLMGITIAVIPSFRDWIGTHRTNAVARTLATDLRMARSMAVDRNHDVIVTFDPVAHTYSVFDDVDRDGPDVSDLVKTVVLGEVGQGAIFGSTSAYQVGGGAYGAAVVMTGSSDPVAVTLKANGEAIHPGVAYLISTEDLAPNRVSRNRAVQILSTGKVRILRWDDANPSDPWVEFF